MVIGGRSVGPVIEGVYGIAGEDAGALYHKSRGAI
ncbi:hypothetical protein PMIT1313_02649 [Prochlorococcus marinus str. MIT 1313]|nr:hypothetical protein PMIT1313_02649 [Prochlorococcus marinus str. MIT 1313]KZR77964.1 hypothetical protein PMIT1318_00047 [Prochlorococcus marinus str. MIT 1318]